MKKALGRIQLLSPGSSNWGNCGESNKDQFIMHQLYLFQIYISCSNDLAIPCE